MEDRLGIAKVGDRTSIIAAATPTLLYPVTPGRTAKIKKIIAYNGQAADVVLEIGDGAAAAFVRRFPRIRLITGFHTTIPVDELPEHEFAPANDIYGQASAAGAAPLDVEVKVEVEEYE